MDLPDLADRSDLSNRPNLRLLLFICGDVPICCGCGCVDEEEEGLDDVVTAPPPVLLREALAPRRVLDVGNGKLARPPPPPPPLLLLVLPRR